MKRKREEQRKRKERAILKAKRRKEVKKIENKEAMFSFTTPSLSLLNISFDFLSTRINGITSQRTVVFIMWRFVRVNTEDFQLVMLPRSHDKQYTYEYNVTMVRVRVTIVAIVKQYYIFRVCVFCVCVWGGGALVTQPAKHIRRFILSSVVCPALQNFSKLSPKGNDFRGGSYWIQNVCFDFLHNLCLKYFSF